MNRITLENYRCFREKQSARLAPLTLLVGENSTGKTSLLALIRALWDVAFLERVPDFREEPYDLGTFRDIAHNRGGRGSQAMSFDAEIEYKDASIPNKVKQDFSFYVMFDERNAIPFPVTRAYSGASIEFQATKQEDSKFLLRLATPEFRTEKIAEHRIFSQDELLLFPLMQFILEFGRPELENELEAMAENLNNSLRWMVSGNRPYASAPIRSRPRRTYDRTRPSRDPEGEYVPTYLASISGRKTSEWSRLRVALEDFGRDSGLFDEIEIKLLGKTEGSPFQIQFRKFGRQLKGVRRNLIDLGYGVSQALPLITELLREDAASMFLLQQPEVHLHPSAQAALGSLFCNIAAQGRQLIVETHSDYILDRVRMDIRDKKTDLNPEDVSILFFEPGELDVTIHSLRLDEDGNISNEPEGYRQFFLDETRRFIGI